MYQPVKMSSLSIFFKAQPEYHMKLQEQTYGSNVNTAIKKTSIPIKLSFVYCILKLNSK